MRIVENTGLIESKTNKQPAPKPGKGRPKRTLLNTLRTKAWAHYCAMRVGIDKPASSGAIAKVILPARKDLDSGRQATTAATWRKYINRTSGVSEGNVDLLDKVWPGSGKIFNHGLFAQKSEHIGDFIFPEAGGHVPLWAAIKGDRSRTRKDNYERRPYLRDFWRDIPPYSWFLWSPWNLPHNPEVFTDFEFNHIEEDDGSWSPLPLMTTVVDGETHKYSMSKYYWRPDNKYFCDDKALISLLYDYANNPACYQETSALLCLTACISINRLQDSPICRLPALFPFDKLAAELLTYDITFEDIAASACELGLTILSNYDYLLLKEGNRALAEAQRDHDEERDVKIYNESLKIREEDTSNNQKYEFFQLDHRRPN